MLEVQKYLLNGKTLTDLETELGIRSTHSEDSPLVILNYDQIDSPKTNFIVRECRGLVLEKDTWKLVSKSFSRFFNWGEVQEEMNLFDFNDFSVMEKCDGSLCLLFNYNGKWMANTRGSFGKFIMEHQDFTWEQAFCKAMKINKLDDLSDKLDPGLTYVCEFVSPYNKVVRTYKEPLMYLLTAFKGEKEVQIVQHDSSIFLRPNVYNFKSIDEIQGFLAGQASNDPTFEGVVMKDKNYLRYKAKSKTYLAFHKMRGEGDNLFAPKHLLPFVLAGESAELLTYFEEATEAHDKVKAKVENAYAVLEQVFNANQGIENQKEFALSIMKKTPFTGLLFQLRKEHGTAVGVEHLKKLWRNNADGILKHLF